MQKSRMLLTGGIVSIFALFLFTGVQGCKETARLEEGKYYEKGNKETARLEEGKYYEEENIEVEGRKYRYVKYCLEHGSGGIRIISMKTEEGILEIEECSFERVHAKQIIIPASMKTIWGLAFAESVTDSVIIKGKDTNLAGYCFEDSKLNRISMPDDFSGEIGDGCFIGSDIESFQWPTYADKDWD